MPHRRVVRKKRWPPLRKIDPNNPPPRQNTPEAIRKLLGPITTVDIGDVSSPESDIPDMFEDVHKESFTTVKKTTKKREISREKFSDLHKSTMKDLQEELKLEGNLLNETYEDVVKAIEDLKEPKPLPPETLASIEKILSDPATVTLSDAIQVEPSEMSYDYMSGFWDMLREHCKGKELMITRENYDAYNQPEPHWLERPSVSQEVWDSKIKCYKWLSEQHE